MVANQRFAPRFGLAALTCSQIRDLLSVSLRSLVHKLSVCSPLRVFDPRLRAGFSFIVPILSQRVRGIFHHSMGYL